MVVVVNGGVTLRVLLTRSPLATGLPQRQPLLSIGGDLVMLELSSARGWTKAHM